MNVRKKHGSDDIDSLICYFMKTILRIKRDGKHTIPIDIVLKEPINGFLETAIGLIEDSQPPEIFDLILTMEYEWLISHYKLKKPDISMLVLIKEITKHIAFDEDNTEYLLATENLWNQKAMDYATKTFLCNLSKEIIQKQGFEFILKHSVKDLLEPTNF